MSTLNQRRQKYSQVSTDLSLLADNKLSMLIDHAEQVYAGIGGKAVVLDINGTQVFVKKVPLTDLERQPENVMSTTNLFDLPLGCQYGIGSPGFGVWRELAVHVMTSNWVIAGQCPNFPILYHWRVLPCQKAEPMTEEQLKALDGEVQYWENSPEVRKRLEDTYNASAQVLLFLEYVPYTLYKWLGDQLLAGEQQAEQAITFVEDNLATTNAFMNSHGLMHFDAHFENILTDGKLLYYSDFGLSLSSKFELTDAEVEFLKTHYNYDTCSTLTNLLHCIVMNLFAKEQWESRLREVLNGALGESLLRECLNGAKGELPPAISRVIQQYGDLVLTMDEFYQKLQKVSKSTPYPAARLEELLMAAQKRAA